MTDASYRSSQPFESRFHPREFGNIAVLLFPETIESDDKSVFRADIESMVAAGIVGFTYDLSRFGRGGPVQEALGQLVTYLVVVPGAGGTLNWFDGARNRSRGSGGLSNCYFTGTRAFSSSNQFVTTLI